MCLCLCFFRDREIGLRKKKVLGLELWSTQPEKGKVRETLVEASSDTDAQFVCYAWVLERKTNRTISQLVPSAVSLRRAGIEQLSLKSEGFQES